MNNNIECIYLLDYFDEHYYPQYPGVILDAAGDAKTKRCAYDQRAPYGIQRILMRAGLERMRRQSA